MKKVGLVLGGGGTKGAYQAGAVKALKELGYSWDIITGTSIGALNGALLVQEDYDELYDLWDNIKAEDIVNGSFDLNFDFEDVISKPNQYLSFFRQYIGSKGADVEPLKKLMEKYFDKDEFFNSNINYGCVTATYPGLKPVYVNKEMMYNHGIDYMLSSSACFPIFPTHKIEDNIYIDGGYSDNLPIDYAYKLGATDIIAIDLFRNPTHLKYMNRDYIKYISPSIHLGPLFNFEKDIVSRNVLCGYYDVYKAYDLYYGYKYTIKKFDKPDFFKSFYLEVLKMESLISKMVNFKDDSYITNYYKKVQNKTVLTEMDLHFGIIDEVMTTLKQPLSKVYSFDEICILILETFKISFSKDYEVLPSLSIDKFREYFDGFDRVGIISKIINQKLYPNKVIIGEDILLSVDPINYAVAQWIIDLVKYLTVK